MKKPRLTYANVVATLSLFIALGGVSWAAATLPANSVGSAQLRNSSVTGAKIANRTITSEKLSADTIAVLKGAKGAVGAQGPQGVQGPVGPQGLKGDIGARGATGATGAKGDQGERGLQGVAGLQGLQGEVGPQGPKGDKGDTGDRGAQGLEGIQGIQGEIGPVGPSGLTGEKGDTGAVGPAGPTGPAGPSGPSGPAGEAGARGPEGPPGPNAGVRLISISGSVRWTRTTEQEQSECGFGYEAVARSVENVSIDGPAHLATDRLRPQSGSCDNQLGEIVVDLPVDSAECFVQVAYSRDSESAEGRASVEVEAPLRSLMGSNRFYILARGGSLLGSSQLSGSFPVQFHLLCPTS